MLQVSKVFLKKLHCNNFLCIVDHLSKYLALRLALDLGSELPEPFRMISFCIYIAPQPHQLVILSGNQTLQQVNEKFWKVSTIFFEFVLPFKI